MPKGKSLFFINCPYLYKSLSNFLIVLKRKKPDWLRVSQNLWTNGYVKKAITMNVNASEAAEITLYFFLDRKLFAITFGLT